MRWRMLALLFLARIGLGFQFQTVASVGDDLVVAFGLDYAGLGVLIGLFMAPGLFLAIPAGYWGRFVSDRIMVVIGLGALALGGLVSSVATDSWAIGLGRVFAGAGFLFTTLYFTKMVADWFEGREIATAMSILVMSWPFGIAMGQVGHAWLAQAYGWPVPFQVASSYCLLAALGVFVFYRPPHALSSAKGGSGAGLTGREWRLVLCAASAWGVFNAAYVTYLSFGPKVLEELGQSTIAAAGIVSIGSWLMILSGAACGQIVDRFGGRNVVLTICMSGAILSLLLLGVQGAGLGASVLFGLIGMAPGWRDHGHGGSGHAGRGTCVRDGDLLHRLLRDHAGHAAYRGRHPRCDGACAGADLAGHPAVRLGRPVGACVPALQDRAVPPCGTDAGMRAADRAGVRPLPRSATPRRHRPSRWS